MSSSSNQTPSEATALLVDYRLAGQASLGGKHFGLSPKTPYSGCSRDEAGSGDNINYPHQQVRSICRIFLAAVSSLWGCYLVYSPPLSVISSTCTLSTDASLTTGMFDLASSIISLIRFQELRRSARYQTGVGWVWLSLAYSAPLLRPFLSGTCISFALGGTVTRTGNPVIPFYMATAIYVATFIYIAVFLPESFPQEKINALSNPGQEPSGNVHPTTTRSADIFEPLKMLVPGRRLDGTRNRRLAWCAAHVFLFTVVHSYLDGVCYINIPPHPRGCEQHLITPVQADLWF